MSRTSETNSNFSKFDSDHHLEVPFYAERKKSFAQQASELKLYKDEVSTARILAVPKEVTELRFNEAIKMRVLGNRKTSNDLETLKKFQIR